MNKKEQIIKIIGFGQEPERAELQAKEITKLFYPEYNGCISTEIKKLERKMEILEAIKSWERRKEMAEDNVKGLFAYFPNLQKKSLNRADTIKRCINKFYNKYIDL